MPSLEMLRALCARAALVLPICISGCIPKDRPASLAPILPLSATPDADFRKRGPPILLGGQAYVPHVDSYALDNGLKVHVLRQPGFPLVSVRYVTGARGPIDDGFDARAAIDSVIAATPELTGFAAGGDAANPWLGDEVQPSTLEHTLSVLERSVAEPRLEERVTNALRSGMAPEPASPPNPETVMLRLALHDVVWQCSRPAHLGSLNEYQARLAAQLAPTASALVVVGDVRRDDVEPLIQRLFGKFRRTPPPDPPSPPIEPIDHPLVRLRLSPLQLPEAYIAVATPAPPLGSADSPAFAVLVQLALLSPSSVLRASYREDWAARLDRTPSWGPDRTLAFSLYVGVGDVAVMTRRITDALRHFQETEPSADDLERARAVLVERLAEAFETPTTAANMFARTVATGLAPEAWSSFAAALPRVGTADIRRVAQRYWAPRLPSIVVFGSQRVRQHMTWAHPSIEAASELEE